MLISPKTAIEEGWVKFPEWMTQEQQDKCIQPNALDFTIDKVFTVELNTPCYIGENSKTMRALTPVTPVSGVWGLEANVYDFMSDFYVNLPIGVAAEVVGRSTFIRNGMLIVTGIWDSGFSGPAGGIIHVPGYVSIEQHVRIGQLKFIRSDEGGTYAGGYNTKQGEHWQTTVKTITTKETL